MRATTTEWQEKMQKEKTNFRKYNEIKIKCLLSSSKVEMFIKIAFVGVRCWGRMLVNRRGLFFKNKTCHVREFLTFCMKWTRSCGTTHSSDVSPRPCCSPSTLARHPPVPIPCTGPRMPQGPKPPACQGVRHFQGYSPTSHSFCQSFKEMPTLSSAPTEIPMALWQEAASACFPSALCFLPWCNCHG